MKGPFLNQRGLALILTIIITSLLVILTVQFGLSMRREYLSSFNQKERAIADGIAYSGVNIALETLAWDGKTNGFDSYQDAWGTLSNRNFSSLFEQGVLHLKVSDLSGRLQINSLVSASKGKQGTDAAGAQKTREILKRLLLSGNFGDIQEERAQEIVDSLVDWIDADDIESPFGAEDGYYRSLDPPYSCKNGQVAFIEELLLVKGMSREILYGTKEHKGLAPLLTVQGNDGKININTADPILLQALDSRMTEEAAKEMVEFRNDENNFPKLSTVTWYKELPGWPTNLIFDEKIITNKSSYFLITSIGEIGSLREKEEVWVSREQNKQITVLSRKVE